MTLYIIRLLVTSSIFLCVVAAGAGAPAEPAPKGAASSAGGVDFCKPLDLYVELIVQSGSAGGGESDGRPAGSTERYEIKILRRVGGPAYRFETTAEGGLSAVGVSMQGEALYAKDGQLQNKPPSDPMSFNAAIYVSLVDLGSMQPFASSMTSPSEGPIEEILLPGGKSVQARPVPVVVCGRPAEGLFAVDDSRLIGARVNVPRWSGKAEISRTYVFDDFREEYGLRFPRTWYLMAKRGQQALATVRVVRVSVLSGLSDDCYSKQNALGPILPEKLVLQPGSEKPNPYAYRMKYPPPIEARLQALQKEDARIRKEYKAGSEDYRKARAECDKEYTALAKEMEDYMKSQLSPELRARLESSQQEAARIIKEYEKTRTEESKKAWMEFIEKSRQLTKEMVEYFKAKEQKP